MTKLKIQFHGEYFLKTAIDGWVSCRTLNGKKAYGLDLRWDKGTVKRLPFDTSWDGSDRVWFAVFENPQDLMKALWNVASQFEKNLPESARNCLPGIGIESGVLNCSKVAKYLRENAALVSEL